MITTNTAGKVKGKMGIRILSLNFIDSHPQSAKPITVIINISADHHVEKAKINNKIVPK